MTHAATLVLPQAETFRLVEALDADPALAALAVDAVEAAPDRWTLTLFTEGPPDAALAGPLGDAVRAVLGDAAPSFAFAPLPDTDWVAKSLEGLTPVRAGRFLVHGAHDRAALRPNDIAIEIEAGEAFGTGHHGTTAGCLLAIERTIAARPIRTALDVGTGSGVLAIAIARRAHIPVLASDIDPVAVRVASANARLNGVAGQLRFVEAAGIGKAVFRRHGRYDLIVANILAGPLVALAPSIRRALAPNGTLILSGLLAGQRARVTSAYRVQGLRLVRSDLLDDWATLTFRRPPR